ncbi:MAG: superoxide dismutase [Cu-Zn] SodC [Geminicoccaceae bacterium]
MRIAAAATTLVLFTAAAQGAEVQATINLIDANGIGAPIGTVTIADGQDGAVITADLHGLMPGEHGFHVHEKGDCGAAANAEGKMTAGQAAGGHLDPEGTKQHEGPKGSGHLGDLPFIFVASDGTAKGASTAPRLTDVGQLKGKAVVIHAGGDNYSDQPKPLGGGGARIACGVLE